MNKNPELELLKQQNYLKSHAEIEYQCYAFKMSEYEFFNHYLWIWALRNNIIDSIPNGIGDIDYSGGMVFEND